MSPASVLDRIEFVQISIHVPSSPEMFRWINFLMKTRPTSYSPLLYVELEVNSSRYGRRSMRIWLSQRWTSLLINLLILKRPMIDCWLLEEMSDIFWCVIVAQYLIVRRVPCMTIFALQACQFIHDPLSLLVCSSTAITYRSSHF